MKNNIHSSLQSCFRLFILICVFLCISSCATQSTALKKPDGHTGPDRVIVMLFDAMRPDFIDRFNLANFKRLRKISQNYRNAYLGYIGAVTSVSHLVLPTGKKPRDLPIQDDVFLDADGKIGEANSFYASTGLTVAQLRTIMKTVPNEETLPFLIKKNFGGKVFAVGEKSYAATELGTLSADSVITLAKENGRCKPDGFKVPNYIQKNERFHLECSKKYGTEDSYYALDGARMVPGDDPAHLGGDIWVADTALEIMKNEPWSGLLLTFGGIDKIMHLLGEVDPHFTHPLSKHIKTEYHLDKVAKIADEQLGRILDELERRSLLDKTLILITADHGCQVDKNYLGNGKTSRWGLVKNDSLKESSAWVRKYTEAGDVAMSYQDTAIRLWMKNRESNREPVIKAMSEVPGVTEIYALEEKLEEKKEGHAYVRVFSALQKQSKKFQFWANRYSQEILDATTTSHSPDLIGLLADETGFDLLGDHGGAQENVQRVPLIIYHPKKQAKIISAPIRTYEFKNEIFRQIGLFN